MATFTPGSDVETTESSVEVTVTPTAPLSAGAHKFQLIVVDDSGNKSDPMVVTVIVKDTQKPTAVLNAPEQVEFGKSFVLTGVKSSDVPPGKVVRFIWTLVG
jgi:hypothetical protein